MIRTCALLLLLAGGISLYALAVPQTLAQDLDGLTSEPSSSGSQSALELIQQAKELAASGRPIDARAKLQKALQLEPENFEVNMLLGAYYLSEVAHFRLAYRYLRKAEDLFAKQHGSDDTVSLSEESWREHARLLYLLAEARLNLDQYQATLATLDRFGQRYWDAWYPGTRAWVLMKLRRYDEAIQVAQAGLMRGADPGRTYNILGILLSLKGSRELSLRAFGEAIRSEAALGLSGQVATPLNNSGEVYREIFSDRTAEASWLKALELPDGCDHILPSLNLTILYTDELRLLQAHRVLENFEACFAARSLREDTEHRVLLALAYGRLAMHIGDEGNRHGLDEAISRFRFARSQEQWFGKIGTSESDVRFAALLTLAQALRSKVSVLRDRQYAHTLDAIRGFAEGIFARLESWWLNRRAREVGIEELADLEDLSIRNTDSMIEYPTLGNLLSGFPQSSLQRRIERMLSMDPRERAHSYYQLYLGTNLRAHGKAREAASLLKKALSGFREFDRLARAEGLAQLIKARRESKYFWQRDSLRELNENLRLSEELFSLLPSRLRYHDLSLPVAYSNPSSVSGYDAKIAQLEKRIFSVRFAKARDELMPSCRYRIQLSVQPSQEGSRELVQVKISLYDQLSNSTIAQAEDTSSLEKDKQVDLVNLFTAASFRHRIDPPGEPLPKLDLLKGIMGNG